MTGAAGKDDAQQVDADQDHADEDRAEELRRRLYRPGAVPQDVAAFVAAHGAPAEQPTDATTPSPVPPLRQRRRPIRFIALVVIVLAGAAGAAAWGLGGAVEARSPAATPLPTASVSPTLRASFVRALVEGHDAGLRAWLAPTGVRAQEGRGTGSANIVVTPPNADAGRLTVYLVLESDGEAGWAPARFAIDADRTIYLDTGRHVSGTLLAGIPAVASGSYTAGQQPIRVVVVAPKGVRWGLAAVFER